MRKTLKNDIIIALKGMAMGAADVVPGVSGGTIAFVSGIYEELLASISAVNFSIFKRWKTAGFKAVWQHVNGRFLLALFTGILISVFSLAKTLKWLLEQHPVLLWAFFFGLVLASVLYIAKQIKKWNGLRVFSLLVGAVFAYMITTLDPMVTENSSTIYLFIAGAIAVCAMILPGISGAFILVLLGAYKPVLAAIDTHDFYTIAVVASGGVTGLLLFSSVLKWLFSHYKNTTLAVLTGIVLGSLNKIWPWKETLTWRPNSHGVPVPLQQISVSPFSFEGDAQLGFAMVLAILGFLVILGLEQLAVKKA